jgi:ribose transport system substrate-binding protein
MYIGPGEHGGGDEQVTIVQDLVAKGVDGIAVSPSNAAAMAVALPGRQGSEDSGPHLGLGSVAGKQGPARRLYRHAQLRHRRQPGEARHGGEAEGRHDLHPVGLARLRPTTTSACRASATRSPGKQSAASPGDRLTGQNGWTEIDGCPLYTNDDFPVSVQQFQDTMAKNPNLDAFIPTGGFPQFIPMRTARPVGPFKEQIASKKLAWSSPTRCRCRSTR